MRKGHVVGRRIFRLRDQACALEHGLDLGPRPASGFDSRIESDDPAQPVAMKERNAENALISLPQELRLKGAGSARQTADVMNRDGLSLGQIAVQPCNQRGGNLLKLRNIGYRTALAPFMRIAKPQKIGRIFDHPRPVSPRCMADDGEKFRNGVPDRFPEQMQGAEIRPVERRRFRALPFGIDPVGLNRTIQAASQNVA